VKLVFDSTEKGWIRLEKTHLFHRQYDIISKKKLFRFDSSLKSETKASPAKIKALLADLKPE
jgi:hypothetical protein